MPGQLAQLRAGGGPCPVKTGHGLARPCGRLTRVHGRAVPPNGRGSRGSACAASPRPGYIFCPVVDCACAMLKTLHWPIPHDVLYVACFSQPRTP